MYIEPDSAIGSMLKGDWFNSLASFNIADAAIVVSMIMFGIFYVFLEQDHEDDGEEI